MGHAPVCGLADSRHPSASRAPAPARLQSRKHRRSHHSRAGTPLAIPASAVTPTRLRSRRTPLRGYRRGQNSQRIRGSPRFPFNTHFAAVFCPNGPVPPNSSPSGSFTRTSNLVVFVDCRETVPSPRPFQPLPGNQASFDKRIGGLPYLVKHFSSFCISPRYRCRHPWHPGLGHPAMMNSSRTTIISFCGFSIPLLNFYSSIPASHANHQMA